MTRNSLVILALAIGSCLALSPGEASASHVGCGDTITADTTLDSDLTNCPGNGILIGADDITLDLNGHTVAGDGELVTPCHTPFRCDVGVLNDGHDGVTIKDGSVKLFEDGVSVMDARDVSVVGISSSENLLDGIIFFNSAESVVRDSSGSGNLRPWGGGIGLYESDGIQILDSSFRNNPTQGLWMDHSSDNLVRGNVASGNAREGFIIWDGTKNRVRGNRSVRNRNGILVDGDGNVIARNRISRAGKGRFEGGHIGEGITIDGRRNLVARNVVVRARDTGIHLEWQRGRVADNVVRRNLVRKSRGDGFLVLKDHNSLLSRNTASGAGDDGFDVNSQFTKLSRNRAVRNGDLYRCSVSIAGVSDLKLLLQEARHFSNSAITREQIGTDWDKLNADSPLRHVDEISMPVLLIHGDADVNVDVDHSRRMAAALKSAKKPHRAVFLRDAAHDINRKSDRITLLSEIEKFLLENLGPGVTGGS